MAKVQNYAVTAEPKKKKRTAGGTPKARAKCAAGCLPDALPLGTSLGELYQTYQTIDKCMCFLLSSRAPLRLSGIQNVYRSLCGDPECVPIALRQVSSVAEDVVCIEYAEDDYREEGTEKWALEVRLPTTAGFTETTKKRREKLVKQALLQHVKRHHDRFLQRQAASQSEAGSNSAWSLKGGCWHPDFDLESVPLPPVMPLPASPEDLEAEGRGSSLTGGKLGVASMVEGDHVLRSYRDDKSRLIELLRRLPCYKKQVRYVSAPARFTSFPTTLLPFHHPSTSPASHIAASQDAVSAITPLSYPLS
jgi:hypothetical protein